MEYTGDYLVEKSDIYATRLSEVKNRIEINWYPHNILHNFHNLRKIFNEYPLDSMATDQIYDIGSADGDLAFFLESLGYRVTCIERRVTNFNKAVGIETLKSELASNVNVSFLDIDSSGLQILDKKEKVSLTFFLGIFYHLQNPLLVLKNLSNVSKYLVFSTRIADFVEGVDISGFKLAYLLGPNELNHDDTNWWIFTKEALFQAFQRTDWEVMSFDLIGDLNHSNPTESMHDLRIYALLRSNKTSPQF
jgi:tRNA (mo5U34)-methyltransferase